eukprot:TRINITY_DN11907_c0_g1_i1.p1 TRINITY_DN11907_c0_g1~~TRINITY_DN11907_c0_g1_i1.p1  ORF type:complete len:281 (-),score=42.58 TRINITY_DN11907_c0_g1_i1:35-772(-)
MHTFPPDLTQDPQTDSQNLEQIESSPQVDLQVIHLQTVIRSHFAQLHLQRTILSAKTIQNWWRIIKSKKEYRKLKQHNLRSVAQKQQEFENLQLARKNYSENNTELPTVVTEFRSRNENVDTFSKFNQTLERNHLYLNPTLKRTHQCLNPAENTLEVKRRNLEEIRERKRLLAQEGLKTEPQPVFVTPVKAKRKSPKKKVKWADEGGTDSLTHPSPFEKWAPKDGTLPQKATLRRQSVYEEPMDL